MKRQRGGSQLVNVSWAVLVVLLFLDTSSRGGVTGEEESSPGLGIASATHKRPRLMTTAHRKKRQMKPRSVNRLPHVHELPRIEHEQRWLMIDQFNVNSRFPSRPKRKAKSAKSHPFDKIKKPKFLNDDFYDSLMPPDGTPSPAPPPTEDCSELPRSEAFVDILTELTPLEDLEDASSPQGQAFEWIVEFDDTTDPCTYPTVLQRYALAVFFYATGGEGWTARTGWLSPAAECDWLGVTCSASSEGATITALSLRANNLVGTFPPEIVQFDTLEELYLNLNSLSGPIPEEFTELTSLEELDLEVNSLSGDPFDVLTQMNTLTRLRISSNDFSGMIPPAIQNLSRLVELWLAENSFSGPLPTELGQLNALRSLFVYSNDLSGPLPAELGNLNLLAFQAHDNQLTGEIPIDFYDIISMEFLRLDSNNLGGSLPEELGQLTNLGDLRLANNSFTGPLPLSFFGLNRLRNVVLRFNSFSGTLRDSFSPWQNLTFFDVAYNEIGGFVPPSLFDLPQIRFLYFHFNQFVGGIPDNYGSPPSLRDLYLNNNQLDGEVPGIDENQLLELNEFLLQENLFVGQMPASVCALRTNGDLEDLYADCNPPGSPEIVCAFPTCCNLCFPLSAMDQAQLNGAVAFP